MVLVWLNKNIKWLKSNISILIFCENVGEFIKESVSCESAPQLIETGHFFRVQYKSPNIILKEFIKTVERVFIWGKTWKNNLKLAQTINEQK